MNSLNKRIDELAETLELTDDNNLIARIQKLEREKKKQKLDELQTTYVSYLVDVLHINDITKYSIDDNIIQIIHLTIKYIKENELNISKLLNVKTSDELIEVVLISLILELTKTYSSDFIKASCYYLLTLFFPKIIEDNIETTSIKEIKEKKKGFFK